MRSSVLLLPLLLSAFACAVLGVPAPSKLYPASTLTPKPLFHEIHGVNANETLREAAARRGIYMGAAVNVNALKNASDPLYRLTAYAEYNLNTAENECKVAETEPDQDTFTYGDCNYILNGTITSASAFRGHNLCWGTYNPSWLLQPGLTTAQLTAMLENHVKTVISNYNTTAIGWDVVNEAISDNEGSIVFKNAAPWYPTVPNYVDLAYQFAAEVASPSVKLFYNDYGAEGLGTKSDKVYNMLQSMLSRKIRVNGVGLQMHVSTTNYPPFADVQKNIARLGALGLDVHITGMLQACLSEPNCKSFETWGFTDLHTWLQTSDEPHPQPLPFDANYQKKPAYFELLSVLQSFRA